MAARRLTACFRSVDRLVVVALAIATALGNRAIAQCQLQHLTALDAAAGDQFGGSVAVSDGLAILGASRHDGLGSAAGAAYVFRDAEGEGWIEEARLLAPDGDRNDLFGSAVALDRNAPGGPVLVAGAYGDDHDGLEDAGAVYVYRGVPDGSGWSWSFETRLVAAGAAAGDQFGLAVAIDGDTIVVGAPRADVDDTNTGAVHVFRDDGAQWRAVTILDADDGLAQDHFGLSVSIDGDVILVGAPLSDAAGNSSGAAYTYREVAESWVFEAKLLPDDAAAGDRFGQSVAISGDVVLAGSYLDDDGGVNAGAAYLYRFDGEWLDPLKLTAAEPRADDRFGRAVAVIDGPGDDDLAVIGAAFDDTRGASAGAAYFYQFDGVDWVERAKLLARDGEAGDELGGAVAITLDAIVVGASSDDHEPAGAGAGAAYVFTTDLDAIDCNGNGVSDACDITEETSGDCDENGVPDECDLEDPERDLNDNGVLDSCEDCNENDVPDGVDIATGTSADCNDNGIPDECEVPESSGGLCTDDCDPDCNGNGVPDACDIAEGAAADCNENGIPDACDIEAGTSLDCNENGVPDACDVDPLDPDGDGLVSEDCDGGGVPDECEDCNDNGIGDTCDIENGDSQDLDGNGVPDECQDCDENGLPDFVEIVFDPSLDCNGNGVLDACEIPDELGACRAETCDPDCNGNGVPDACDIAEGIEADCDGNGVPDPCDPDCNDNGVPDACDVDPEDPDGDGHVSDDANGNGVPDECEDCNDNGVPDDQDIESGASLDCNVNGTPDECEIPEDSGGFCTDECDPDCNGNGVPDACDIDGGGSHDFNDNGVPDECEPDCNRNGIPDFLDILFGTSEDANENGIPDECEVCPADLNFDGVVDFEDVLDVLAAWGPCLECPEDLDDSGFVDFGDVLLVLAAWGAC